MIIFHWVAAIRGKHMEIKLGISVIYTVEINESPDGSKSETYYRAETLLGKTKK
jgi:hypothetical protein